MANVPLVIYTPAGVRTVIGTCEIEETEEGLIGSATITDSKMVESMMESGLYSIGEEVKPKRHNVFDKDKDDKS